MCSSISFDHFFLHFFFIANFLLIRGAHQLRITSSWSVFTISHKQVMHFLWFIFHWFRMVLDVEKSVWVFQEFFGATETNKVLRYTCCNHHKIPIGLTKIDDALNIHYTHEYHTYKHIKNGLLFKSFDQHIHLLNNTNNIWMKKCEYHEFWKKMLRETWSKIMTESYGKCANCDEYFFFMHTTE